MAGTAGVVSESGLGLLKTVSRYGEPLQERKLTVAEVQHGWTATTARTTANSRRSWTACSRRTASTTT